MATQTMEVDEKVLHARTGWIARFIAGGVPISDFIEVTNGVERWQDWCSAWSARAAIHESIGREALAAGFGLSAGQHLITASVCYHFGKFLFCDYPDEMRTAHVKAVECRTLALPHLNPPGERAEIPYQGKHLFANLRRPRGIERPPVVILIPGMDSTKEEFHHSEQLFLDRGMATLSLDGPGQGEAEYDFPIRHDYEVPCATVIDWVQARDDLDGARIGLSGASMGGYYVPRVVAFETRVAAAIANGGAYAVQPNFDQRPDTLKQAYRLRTHSASVAEAREKTAAFNLEGVAKTITCPMFIIGALEDRITSYKDAERLAGEVSGPVELRLLEGANHVAHNRGHMFKTQAADWMAGHLGV